MLAGVVEKEGRLWAGERPNARPREVKRRSLVMAQGVTAKRPCVSLVVLLASTSHPPD